MFGNSTRISSAVYSSEELSINAGRSVVSVFSDRSLM